MSTKCRTVSCASSDGEEPDRESVSSTSTVYSDEAGLLGSSDEEDEYHLDAFWLKWKHRVLNRTSSIWRQSVHSLSENDEFHSELLQAEQEDHQHLESILNARQTMLERAVEGMHRKYEGQRNRLQAQIKQEKRRVREFFYTLVDEEKTRIKSAIEKKAQDMNVAIEHKLDVRLFVYELYSCLTPFVGMGITLSNPTSYSTNG